MICKNFIFILVMIVSGISSLYGMETEFLSSVQGDNLNAVIIKHIKQVQPGDTILFRQSFLSGQILHALRGALKKGIAVEGVIADNSRTQRAIKELAENGALIYTTIKKFPVHEKTWITPTSIITGSRNGSGINHADGIIIDTDVPVIQEHKKLHDTIVEKYGKIYDPFTASWTESPCKGKSPLKLVPHTPSKKTFLSSVYYDLNEFNEKRISASLPTGWKEEIDISTMLLTDSPIKHAIIAKAQNPDASVRVICDGATALSQKGREVLQELVNHNIPVHIYNSDREKKVWEGSNWAQLNHFKGMTRKRISPHGKTKNFTTIISTGNATEASKQQLNLAMVDCEKNTHEKIKNYCNTVVEKSRPVNKRLLAEFDAAACSSIVKKRKQ